MPFQHRFLSQTSPTLQRRSRMTTPQSAGNVFHGLFSAHVDARDVAKYHLMQYEMSFDTVSDEDLSRISFTSTFPSSNSTQPCFHIQKGFSKSSSCVMSSLDPNMTNFTKAMYSVYKFPSRPSGKKWISTPAAAGHKGRYLWTGNTSQSRMQQVLNTVRKCLWGYQLHYPNQA
jgi:hypothetical protein